MATKLLKKTPVKKNNQVGKLDETPQKSETVKIPPIKKKILTLRIVGVTPLITHKWSEKARKELRDKHAGKKTKDRQPRNPEKEGHDATYFTDDGEYGLPAMAIKTAMLTAAHKDLGVPKTVVCKGVFLEVNDSGMILPIEGDEPIIQEDTVRVSNGQPDLRYRPYFYKWRVVVSFLIDESWLNVQDILNLIERAGFGVGICEWRPEKGGEFGRFKIDTDYPIKIS